MLDTALLDIDQFSSPYDVGLQLCANSAANCALYLTLVSGCHVCCHLHTLSRQISGLHFQKYEYALRALL